jgi:NADH dehydrogenase [ubiquinone] 1 alpha subcomplex assembly factor 1
MAEDFIYLKLLIPFRMIFIKKLLVCMLLYLAQALNCIVAETLLFDFTDSDNVDSFHEISDTVRNVGLSKAQISILESDAVRRAVLFTLLNPQENSACFAGVATAFQPALVLSAFSVMGLQVRAQGMYSNFKVVLQDGKSESNSSLAFEQFFFAASDVLSVVSLKMDAFRCTYRGKACEETLDTDNIVSFGLQAAGGVYQDDFTNRGSASLEIDFVSLA